MVTKLLRNPQALSSALTVLGMLQPRALRFLKSLVTLVLASNYCIVQNDGRGKLWQIHGFRVLARITLANINYST